MSSEQALIKAKDKEIEILRRRLEGLVVKDNGQSEGSVNADQVQNVRPVANAPLILSLPTPSQPWKHARIDSTPNWPSLTPKS